MADDRHLTISSSGTSAVRLTAEDVVARQFSTVRRGLDPGEVRGFLELVARELAAAAEREAELRQLLAAAEHRAAHPEVDEETLTAVLGQETTRVLRAARDAAADVVQRAEEEAARLRSEAQEQADRTQSRAQQRADEQLALSEQAASDIRRRAQEEATTRVEQARADAEALVAQARAECRAMVHEAQELRARVLNDLAKRRRLLHSQIEQLRAGRERLAQTIQGVRAAVDQVAEELLHAEDDARQAAEAARAGGDAGSGGDTGPGLVVPGPGDTAVGEDAGAVVPGPGDIGVGGAAARAGDAGDPPGDTMAETGVRATAPRTGSESPAGISDEGVTRRSGEAVGEPGSPFRTVVVPPVEIVGATQAAAAAGRPSVPERPGPGPRTVSGASGSGPRTVSGIAGSDAAAGADVRGPEAGRPGADRPDEGGPDAGGPDADGPDADGPDAGGVGGGAAAGTGAAGGAPASGPGPDTGERPAEGGLEDGERTPARSGSRVLSGGRRGSADVDALFARLRAGREPDGSTGVDAGAGGGVAGEDDGPAVRLLQRGAKPRPRRRHVGHGGHTGGAPGVATSDEPSAAVEATASGAATDGEETTAPGRPVASAATTGEAPPPDVAAEPTEPEPEEMGPSGSREVDGPLLQQRDDAVRPVVAHLSRRLKRCLQDDQNDLLDRLRHQGRRPVDEPLVPDEAAHRQRYVDAVSSVLADAVRAGVSFAGGASLGSPGSVGAGVGAAVAGRQDEQATSALAAQVAADLAALVVASLRRRLEDGLSDLGSADAGDESRIADRIGAAFREWKGSRVEALAADHVVAAFNGGIVQAVPAGTALRWVVDDDGGACADCDDNALADQVPCGDAFPTGHRHPPAHSGCRCLLVPVGP